MTGRSGWADCRGFTADDLIGRIVMCEFQIPGQKGLGVLETIGRFIAFTGDGDVILEYRDGRRSEVPYGRPVYLLPDWPEDDNFSSG